MWEVKSGREKIENRVKKSRVNNGIGEQNAEELSNASKKKVSIGSDIRKSSAVRNAEVGIDVQKKTLFSKEHGGFVVSG